MHDGGVGEEYAIARDAGALRCERLESAGDTGAADFKRAHFATQGVSGAVGFGLVAEGRDGVDEVRECGFAFGFERLDALREFSLLGALRGAGGTVGLGLQGCADAVATGADAFADAAHLARGGIEFDVCVGIQVSACFGDGGHDVLDFGESATEDRGDDGCAGTSGAVDIDGIDPPLQQGADGVEVFEHVAHGCFGLLADVDQGEDFGAGVDAFDLFALLLPALEEAGEQRVEVVDFEIDVFEGGANFGRRLQVELFVYGFAEIEDVRAERFERLGEQDEGDGEFAVVGPRDAREFFQVFLVCGVVGEGGVEGVGGDHAAGGGGGVEVAEGLPGGGDALCCFVGGAARLFEALLGLFEGGGGWDLG